MSEVQTAGKVLEGKDAVYVVTQRPPIDNLSNDVMVLWHDRRAMSPEQRRKAWALMGEIAAFQGETKETVYAEQKTAFTLKHLDTLQDGLFRLSTADMSTARAFITMLVDIIIEYGIPTKEPLADLCEDIEKYVYSCLINKKCAVCGQRCDLHHVDRVGMGGDRKTMNHLGMRCLPLCRGHHQEAHQIGDQTLMERYHLVPIRIDQKIADVYHLNTKDRKEGRVDVLTS